MEERITESEFDKAIAMLKQFKCVPHEGFYFYYLTDDGRWLCSNDEEHSEELLKISEKWLQTT